MYFFLVFKAGHIFCTGLSNDDNLIKLKLAQVFFFSFRALSLLKRGFVNFGIFKIFLVGCDFNTVHTCYTSVLSQFMYFNTSPFSETVIFKCSFEAILNCGQVISRLAIFYGISVTFFSSENQTKLDMYVYNKISELHIFYNILNMWI